MKHGMPRTVQRRQKQQQLQGELPPVRVLYADVCMLSMMSRAAACFAGSRDCWGPSQAKLLVELGDISPKPVKIVAVARASYDRLRHSHR